MPFSIQINFKKSDFCKITYKESNLKSPENK